MSESGIQQPSIAILMESDYYEPEISYYQRRFDEVGIRVDFVGRLWATFAHVHRPPTWCGERSQSDRQDSGWPRARLREHRRRGPDLPCHP